MQKVVSLAQYRGREVIDTLRHFLRLAEGGDLKGVCVCGLDGSGAEQIAVAGNYRTEPTRAVAAGMRMSWRLTQLQDEAHIRQ
jgi:hypothetical protein